MKKVFWSVLMAFAVGQVQAAIPTTAEGWYTPEGGFSTIGAVAEWTQGGKQFKCVVSDDGVQWGASWPSDYATRTALEKALNAEYINCKQEEAIEQIGKNLNSIGLSQGIEVNATDPNGGKHTYTLKFGKSNLQQTVNTEGKITITDPSASYNQADEKSLHWNDSNKMELKGWNGADSGTDLFDYTAGAVMLRLTPGGATGPSFMPWRGVDKASLEKNATSKKLEIKGFATGGNCTASLGAMLTTDTANRGKHQVMARFSDGGTPSVHWVSIGTVNEGDGITPDDESIEYAIEGSTTNYAVYGYSTAKEYAEEDDLYIPYADGGNALGWKSFADFFADSVFKTSDSGKILLNGTSESSDKFSVLAIKTGEGDTQEVGTFNFDGASVDGQVGTASTIQLHGFAEPSPAVQGRNFADMMTNTAVSVAGMSIPVRVSNGTDGAAEIKYASLAKLAGIPAASVDNKTIELDNEEEGSSKLQLKDSQLADKGDIFVMGARGVAGWQSITEGVLKTEDEEFCPAKIYTGENGMNYITLRGWNTTDIGQVMYGTDSEGHPAVWAAEHFLGLEIGAYNGRPTLHIEGFEDADNGSIPYKSGNGSEGSIDWLEPTGNGFLTMSTTASPSFTAAGDSLDINATTHKLDIDGYAGASIGKSPYKTNNGIGWDYAVKGVKTDNGSPLAVVDENNQRRVTMTLPSGATTASPKALVSNGSSIYWGNAAGGIAAVDNITISTNEAGHVGQIALKGSASADNYTFPVMRDAAMSWRGISAGSGISITKPASGDFVISQTTLTPGSSSTGANYQNITFISDISYNPTTHEFTAVKKTASVVVLGNITTTSDVIFRATSHAAEHIGD